VHHYSPRTIEAYLYWIKFYIHFHQKRHPSELGDLEIERFLTFLALEQLGHQDVKTTEIYTHVLKRGARGVRSPLSDLNSA